MLKRVKYFAKWLFNTFQFCGPKSDFEDEFDVCSVMKRDIGSGNDNMF